MPSLIKQKNTLALYGKDYQLAQAQKYRERHNNHWKFRIGMAHSLVEQFALPKLRGKPLKEIIIVDIGCSIGTFAIEFAKLGYRSFGIDFDQTALKIAEELCTEEKASAEFICGDVSDWHHKFPAIDIAICFDIFEHLHDDELGSLLTSIKKNLSDKGSLIFHTFPTKFDYIFFEDSFLMTFLRVSLLPFKNISPPKFDRIVKIYASLIDIILIMKSGETYKDKIKYSTHCNPTTKQSLIDIIQRAGYSLVHINTTQLYPFKQKIQRQFINQPITHRNLYGVAVPKANKTDEI